MIGWLPPNPAPVAVTVVLPGAAGPHETDRRSDGAANAGRGTCANTIATQSRAVVTTRHHPGTVIRARPRPRVTVPGSEIRDPRPTLALSPCSPSVRLCDDWTGRTIRGPGLQSI